MAIAKVAGQTIGALAMINGATAPVDTYTKLLLHCDGADASTTFTDASPSARGNATVEGTAQVDTAQSQLGFGGASLLLDGNSDYVSFPDSADWNFSTSAYTIDCWGMFNNLPASGGYAHFCGQYVGVNDAWFIQFFNDGGTHKIRWFQLIGGSVNFNNIFTLNSNLSTATWYHFAFVRNGANMYVFVGGVPTADSPKSSADGIDLAAILTIGAYETGPSRLWDGWIDEVRVSKGIARWTTTFTPPTMAYGKTVKVAGVTA